MSQTNHGLLIHAVFSTKGRRGLIADQWRDELYVYIGGTVVDHNATLVAAGGIEGTCTYC